MKKSIILMCSLIAFLSIAILTIFDFQNKNIIENSTEIAENNNQLREDSPYSLEELHSFITLGDIPSEAIPIYENWYDYFPITTPFVNSYGESFNFDEYNFIKAKWNDDFFFPRIISLTHGFVEALMKGNV